MRFSIQSIKQLYGIHIVYIYIYTFVHIIIYLSIQKVVRQFWANVSNISYLPLPDLWKTGASFQPFGGDTLRVGDPK